MFKQIKQDLIAKTRGKGVPLWSVAAAITLCSGIALCFIPGVAAAGIPLICLALVMSVNVYGQYLTDKAKKAPPQGSFAFAPDESVNFNAPGTKAQVGASQSKRSPFSLEEM
jgi:hypothetical protein